MPSRKGLVILLIRSSCFIMLSAILACEVVKMFLLTHVGVAIQGVCLGLTVQRLGSNHEAGLKSALLISVPSRVRSRFSGNV